MRSRRPLIEDVNSIMEMANKEVLRIGNIHKMKQLFIVDGTESCTIID